MSKRTTYIEVTAKSPNIDMRLVTTQGRVRSKLRMIRELHLHHAVYFVTRWYRGRYRRVKTYNPEAGELKVTIVNLGTTKPAKPIA